ncbi:MAG TPA: chromate efflux transporter [Thermoanaerobaculia bacterium]
MTASPKEAEPPPAVSLGRLALLFLKLGTLAFGGPAAHIAMMEDELVRRRQWVRAADFLDLLAVANLLPGPSSTELAIFLGYRLCGVAGLLLAGTCFVLPAFLIVASIAWAYVLYGHLPAAAGLLYGVKPVVIAIVLQALWRLGRSAFKTRLSAALGLLALAVSFAGVPPLPVLAGTAIVAAAVARIRRPRSAEAALGAVVPVLPLAGGAAGGAGLSGIFLVFLKVGAVVFGSGYVLLAFLRADLVVQRHWLTEAQLLDAIAVGQVTPGPVFTTATFIGYVLKGLPGAVVATVGIFAPAFLFVAATGPLVRALRSSRLAGAALDGLNAGSLALMAFVTWQLGRTAIVDRMTLGLAIVSAFLLFRYRLNATWLVLGAGLLGAGLALAGS